jgi:hypothetical protein
MKAASPALNCVAERSLSLTCVCDTDPFVPRNPLGYVKVTTAESGWPQIEYFPPEDIFGRKAPEVAQVSPFKTEPVRWVTGFYTPGFACATVDGIPFAACGDDPHFHRMNKDASPEDTRCPRCLAVIEGRAA